MFFGTRCRTSTLLQAVSVSLALHFIALYCFSYFVFFSCIIDTVYLLDC